MTLEKWIEQFETQFTKREFSFLKVQKVMIQLQLIDTETEEIHLHNLQFTAKGAVNLKLKK